MLVILGRQFLPPTPDCAHSAPFLKSVLPPGVLRRSPTWITSSPLRIRLPRRARPEHTRPLLNPLHRVHRSPHYVREPPQPARVARVFASPAYPPIRPWIPSTPNIWPNPSKRQRRKSAGNHLPGPMCPQTTRTMDGRAVGAATRSHGQDDGRRLPRMCSRGCRLLCECCP